MVRTKADCSSIRVSAAKAPRKISSGASSSSYSSSSPSRSGSSKDRYSGGNPYNPQPIPSWQKGISAFFKAGSSKENESEDPSSSSSDPQIKIASPQKQDLNETEISSCSSAAQAKIDSPQKQDLNNETLDKNGVISDDD